MRPNSLFVAALCFLVAVPGAPTQELTKRGTFKGHKFPVDRTALSPDDKVLAAGGGNGTGGELKLYDAAIGKEIAALPGYTSFLFSLVFSADGKRLASGGYEQVQVWDMSSHKEIASFKDPGFGSIVALNRDGTKVAAVGSNQAKLWEVASGRELSFFRHHVPISGWLGAAFNRDLAILAARNYQEIDLWDTATCKEKVTLSEHRGEVCCMAWSADDKTLIASSTRYKGKDNKWHGDLKLWDVLSGKERATLPGPFGHIRVIAPSLDGKTLALLDRPDLYAEFDLKLVDVDTGRQRVVAAPPTCSFLSTHFTSQGKLLVTGTSVDTLWLWEVALPKRGMKP